MSEDDMQERLIASAIQGACVEYAKMRMILRATMPPIASFGTEIDFLTDVARSAVEIAEVVLVAMKEGEQRRSMEKKAGEN